MHLLVTGGAGFIGANFVRFCLTQTLTEISSVTVLDKLTYAGVKENLDCVKNSPKFRFVNGDICDPSVVFDLIKNVDAVVNFAAESHVDRSIYSASHFVNTNIVGVQILLDAIKQTKGKKRFLQVSTDEVYGSINAGSWDENAPLQPNSPYSASKASGDLIARSYYRTHEMDIVVTRCSNNYGPSQFPEKLIPLFITNLLEKKKLNIYGNGMNMRDWIHVEDHCKAILMVLVSGRSGEVYNIGGDKELTNLQVTEMILGAMGADASSIEFVQDRKGHDFRYSIDFTKIRRELGFEPEINFKSGLEDTIDWYKNHWTWWEKLKIGRS